MRKNSSSDHENLLKFDAEGRKFANILRLQQLEFKLEKKYWNLGK